MIDWRGARLGLILVSLASTAVPAAATLPALPGQPVPTLAPLVSEVTPAVVNISVRGRIREDNPLFNDPFFRRFFDMPSQIVREVQATGSGVIVDAQRGYILTNNHVVEGTDEIAVVFSAGQHTAARIVGTDPESDPQ